MPAAADEGFWRGRPTLVTGGSGLLGRWLVALLRERGAEVIAVVRPRSCAEALLPFGPGWKGVTMASRVKKPPGSSAPTRMTLLANSAFSPATFILPNTVLARPRFTTCKGSRLGWPMNSGPGSR